MGPEFSAKVVDILARRAALRCANPDCDKLTSGPNLNPSKVTNIGEAAHIYGARVGSARYRDRMNDHDRATISNAIWLCRDCHGLIDKDVGRFSAELLILWKERHETKIINELGKPGDLIRFQLSEKEMEEFSSLPGFIRLLLRDKPEFWEYTVTSELLDYFLNAPLEEAGDLKEGLYSRPIIFVPLSEFNEWYLTRSRELTDVIGVLQNLLQKLMKSWGAPGELGNPHKIVHACRLIGENAKRLTVIANEGRFTRLSEEFEGISKLISDSALHILYRFPEISNHLRSVLGQPNPTGSHTLTLIIDLPENWERDMSRLLASAAEKVRRRS